MSAARPDTWMPTYWGDYARDTGHLNATLHGAYLMLIKHYWCSGRPLPDDDAVLWRVATCDSPAQWRRLRPTLAAFFQIDGGEWRHRRVDAELERALGYIRKQTENGQKGGRPKKPDAPKTETQEKPTGKPSLNPNITKPQPQPQLEGISGQQQRSPEPARPSAAAEPPPPPESPDLATPAFLLRDARRRALAIVEGHFPDLRNDPRAYPALTSSQGLVQSWIGDGADLDRDILPAIEAECLKLRAKGKKPIGFSWFADAVAANKTRNSAPLSESNHGQRASPDKPLSAGQRELAALAGILGQDLGGPLPGGGPADFVVVDADAVAVEG